jgi:Tfp pilus assembly protein PilN
MIAMIRVNLLRTREIRRSVGAPVFVGVWIALLLAMGAALYLWYAKLDEERAAVSAQAAQVKAEVEGLTDVKKKLEEREAQLVTITKQNEIFEALKNDKLGPAQAMGYLGYALTPKEDNLFNVDELRAQEDAGWDIGWDSSRVWITGLDEKNSEVTIKGQAIDHEDVTELSRRLESSNFYHDVRLGTQEVKTDDTIGAQFVEFRLKARVNHDPRGIPYPADSEQAKAATTAAAGAKPTDKAPAAQPAPAKAPK